MKVLLIQPPVRDFYQTRIRTQPIGLAYLAASLRLQGVEAAILDCQTGRQRSIPVPPQFSHLHEIYPSDDRSPFRLYSGFYHFGMGWEEIRQEIDAFEPDAVGISSLFTPYHDEALEVARIVKQGDPSRNVVMGGPHVSGDPEGVLNSGLVDYVVLGEGEVRLPRLLKAI
jgi:anaerobic magnesium-protoporphyrin IX monomethyl ester cyclase